MIIKLCSILSAGVKDGSMSALSIASPRKSHFGSGGIHRADTGGGIKIGIESGKFISHDVVVASGSYLANDAELLIRRGSAG